MQKNLYFICPTDHLEFVIDNTFKQRNYYCTSLGNSMAFDPNTVGQISRLIETKKINEISFVLSDENNIVLDAIGKQDFSGITGLNNFYSQIIKQKEHSEVFRQTNNFKFLLLSYHLNNKIKELRQGLKTSFSDQLKISGKIYNSRERVFYDIYSDLVCGDSFHLN